MKPGILYISYDGMLEPLGQSQVLAYLVRLAVDRRIHLISFEKPDDWTNETERQRITKYISDAGIVWHPLTYHKHPTAFATLWDIGFGTLVALLLTLRYGLRVVHARSYVSSVIALSIKKLLGVSYIFDMRGFWADERVDGGIWKKDSWLYQISKWFEKRFLLNADVVVSLTHAATKEMRQFSYLQSRMPTFEVVTTCTNLNLFKPEDTLLSVRSEPFNLGYVGSVSVSYLFDETLQCFKLLQQVIPDARLHILNRGEHEYILERINHHNINPESVRLETKDHEGVVRAMREMHAGIFFIKKVYSKVASAPTKLGEFLGCGVPCLGNVGVGDMGVILEKERVGVALLDFSEDAMRKALVQLVLLTKEPDIKHRCRKVAFEYFSLEQGVDSYSKIYTQLLLRN